MRTTHTRTATPRGAELRHNQRHLENAWARLPIDSMDTSSAQIRVKYATQKRHFFKIKTDNYLHIQYRDGRNFNINWFDKYDRVFFQSNHTVGISFDSRFGWLRLQRLLADKHVGLHNSSTLILLTHIHFASGKSILAKSFKSIELLKL